MFFIAYVFCRLRLFRFKTGDQKIYSENLEYHKVTILKSKFLLISG